MEFTHPVISTGVQDLNEFTTNHIKISNWVQSGALKSFNVWILLFQQNLCLMDNNTIDSIIANSLLVRVPSDDVLAMSSATVMLVIEMSKVEHNIELSKDEDEDLVSLEFNTSKLLFSSSDNMSHKVVSSGLMGFVGVGVVSLFPCTLHPGHIQFVLALFG